MARILILPSGNTFSHLRECELIGAELLQFGHDVHFGISKYYGNWAASRGFCATLLPEIWERGPTDHPNISWFIDHEYLSNCIRAEIELIRTYGPDYILADFKYTSGISARVTGTPLISKNILSMLPETKVNFGYLEADQSPASRLQKKYLQFFNHFASVALNQTSLQFGLTPRSSMADFLDGDWVLVPDFPWFHQKKSLPVHYLPVNIMQQSRCIPNPQAVTLWGIKRSSKMNTMRHIALSNKGTWDGDAIRKKTLFLALGSVCRSQEVLLHLTAALAAEPFDLYVSMSGANVSFEKELQKINPQARIAPFWDFEQLAIKGLDLYICQGGLGSIFHGLEHAIPLLILPLQPEQDHNGMLVEKHGLGSRLGPSLVCTGREDLYIQAILETPRKKIVDLVHTLLVEASYKEACLRSKERLLAEVAHLPSAAQTIDTLLNIKKNAVASMPVSGCSTVVNHV